MIPRTITFVLILTAVFGLGMALLIRNMPKRPKTISILIVAFFSVWGSICGMALTAEETGFHCSLGLDGRFMAEGTFRISEDGSALQYKLVVHNVEDITMAHLHLGKVGELGTPVVWLYPERPPPKLIPGVFDGVLAEGTITGDDLIGSLRGQPLSSLIAHIRAGNVYVNIHTRPHPRGDICGPVSFTEE